MVSKILAFVAALSLFLPREVLPAGQGPQASEERAYCPRDVFAIGQDRQASQERAQYPQDVLAVGGPARDSAQEHIADV
jgi:hypothetical protein